MAINIDAETLHNAINKSLEKKLPEMINNHPAMQRMMQQGAEQVGHDLERASRGWLGRRWYNATVDNFAARGFNQAKASALGSLKTAGMLAAVGVGAAALFAFMSGSGRKGKQSAQSDGMMDAAGEVNDFNLPPAGPAPDMGFGAPCAPTGSIAPTPGENVAKFCGGGPKSPLEAVTASKGAGPAFAQP